MITGGAGFIGSNLVSHFLSTNNDVVVVDNFSTGRREFLANLLDNPRLQVLSLDLSEFDLVVDHFEGVDAVVHLSANADVRFGWNHPRRDFEQNVLVTQNVLEAMREHKIRKIIFSSTGSVYGEAHVVPTPEDCPFPIQTSLYGASKAAAEGIISAYSESGFVDATIFRFVSILGPRYTHGHVIDFVAKLHHSPDQLQVLGDGTQRKSYLHVDDCIAAILSRLDSREALEIFNLGTDESCTVNDSVGWITSRLGLNPKILYSGGKQGWVGDNPLIHLDTSRLRATGWLPRYSIQDSVERTVDWIVANPWVLNLAVVK
jgi:UDP-glucose 4-epimerase